MDLYKKRGTIYLNSKRYQGCNKPNCSIYHGSYNLFWKFFTISLFFEKHLQEFLSLKSSGIPEAEIFGRKRKFSLFGFRFRPPNIKAEYGRKSNVRLFLNGLLNSRKYCQWHQMVSKQIGSNVKFSSYKGYFKDKFE